MRAVLGIDAAWTTKNPSGVALAIETRAGWKLVTVAASYRDFHALANRQERVDPTINALPDGPTLLASSAAICGRPVDLVAVDIPLSRTPIVARRASDDAVSRAYGGRWCSTHTPNALRPGRISDDLKRTFERAGYALQTVAISPPGLIEVYPHPALVELANAPTRLPYKAGNVGKYWPELNSEGRHLRLYQQWRQIVLLLDREIGGVADALPELAVGLRGVALKSYEDKLDAVVCAWVAICALKGKAEPFGDEESAIWIPAPLHA